MKNPIYPCLWFDGQAKEAAEFYCKVFDNSEITADTPIVVTIKLNGQKFMCLNGGPIYKPNPSVSFFVICETTEEAERLWNNFSEEGSVLMPLDKYEWSEKYGWVQDKFGISWQIFTGKMQDTGQKFSPMLLFTNEQKGRAEESINFYTSVFENSSIAGILKYSENDNDTEGTVKHSQFTIGKAVFMAMDSSAPHQFSFSEGISFVAECETQDEIDYYWNKLTEGGQESMCGWLKDKFGISWQIVPSVLGELMSDPEKSQRVMQTFLKMKKFDIEKLLQA
jgi:predicted 3-demethylubiquinone-9 3-methyltransferase (glyoxalase superfamily)